MKNLTLFQQSITPFICIPLLILFSFNTNGQSVGSSLNFDGVNDYVQLSGTNDFGAVSNFQNAFTFEAWVKNDGSGNWGRVFDFGDSTSEYIFFTPQASTGKPRFVCWLSEKPEIWSNAYFWSFEHPGRSEDVV